MSEPRQMWLVMYDIRDPKRWRKAYKVLRGFGERVQFSVFRCRLTRRQMERLRWVLEQRLDAEDSILFVSLCDRCLDRVVARNAPTQWPIDDDDLNVRVV